MARTMLAISIPSHEQELHLTLYLLAHNPLRHSALSLWMSAFTASGIF